MPERAKELFLKYHGNRFYMDHDGVGSEYESYHVSKETEAGWAEEFVTDFLGSEKTGKEAVNDYSAAADLVKAGSENDNWEQCLYYPLRAEHLDDVTVLFMLPISFRMAERAAKKHMLSGSERDIYLIELDSFSEKIKEHTEKGSLTRADDYVMREFSDPDYTINYLNELKKKWNSLSRI